MAYSPLDLTKKVVLVTGGNRGIGLGMARAMGLAGADLVIWGSNAERNEQAQKELAAEVSGKVFQQQVDVSDEGQVKAAMRAAVEEMGRIDSVFANAGIGKMSGPFTDIPYDDFREVLAVNLDGVFYTLREACVHMVARAKNGDPGGSLVGVASIAAIDGAARNQHYAASKGGVISMMKGIAVEHARYGIRANSLLPGWIATDMTAGSQNSEVFTERVIPRIPIRRWGEPDDFGGIAVYLASDASRYHSGDILKVDGAYSIF